MSVNEADIAVIGAGAAGMMAAGRLGELGYRVLLFEKKKEPGRKLAITGKGRCNVTNLCQPADFITAVRRNPRFLYTAVNRFTPQDTMNFFETLGVPLKIERGRRVFPQSDRAADIVSAMKKYCFASGRVTAVYTPVDEILYDTVSPALVSETIEAGHAPYDEAVKKKERKKERHPIHLRVKGVKAGGRTYTCSGAILCTGGLSYPLTGSDGDGYRLAAEAGHTIEELQPSLVPLVVEEDWCAALQGLSLRNIAVSCVDTDTERVVYEDFGELLFTHFGLSGPVILSMSSHMAPHGHYRIDIDLKPALDEPVLDARLISDFTKYANRDFINALDDLLPQKLIPVIVAHSGIDPRGKTHSITHEERRRLLGLLKHFSLTFRSFRPIEEAIVTAGGVSVKEIDPRTMASKCAEGLFFAGEVIDVDAYTGGYNLQIAFSTARLAAEGASVVFDRLKNN